MDDFVASTVKAKVLVIIVPGLLMSVVSLYMALGDESWWEGGRRSSGFLANEVGFFGTVFFGFATLRLFALLFVKGDHVRIDQQGISLPHSQISFISWGEIAGIKSVPTQAHWSQPQQIVLVLDKSSSLLSNRLRRFWYAISSGGPSFSMFLTDKTHFEALLAIQRFRSLQAMEASRLGHSN